MRLFSTIFLLGLLFFLSRCKQESSSTTATEIDQEKDSVRYIERIAPELDAVLSENTPIEILAEGFDWSEGPLWLPGQKKLIFSDIPPNIIYQWQEGVGVDTFLFPSGYTGASPRGGEVGSNGLLLNASGQLMLCQHGNRQIARMDASLDDPQPKYIALADRFDGKRFNSPNDAAFHPGGDLFFTDPPYGLEHNMEDPAKEIPFQGVYRIRADGQVSLVIDSITRPNGIGFSPDGSKMYVASSDPDHAVWLEYTLDAGGTPVSGRILYDATSLVATDPGLPDGMCIDAAGRIFATGPGGVWIFSSSGNLIGKIRTGALTANCTIGGTDGKNLFLTADSYLMRVKLL